MRAGDPALEALAELSQIAVELARALGAAEGKLDAQDVIEQLALQSLNDGTDRRIELYEGFARWVATEPL